jgi:hypothetical protein
MQIQQYCQGKNLNPIYCLENKKPQFRNGYCLEVQNLTYLGI